MSEESERLAERNRKILSELRHIGEMTDCHWTVMYVRYVIKKYGGDSE